MRLWLSDHLLDLDQPVKVRLGGRVIHEAVVPRDAAAIRESIGLRPDPGLAATAILDLPLPDEEQAGTH